uniref:Uncharacterized protein n=1 Tax=Ciona savignyi TaxID=51511 RepID=H2YJC3_CIOSA
MPHLHIRSRESRYIVCITKGYEEIVTCNVFDAIESFHDNINISKQASGSSKCSMFQIKSPPVSVDYGCGYIAYKAQSLSYDVLHVVLLDELAKCGWKLLEKSTTEDDERTWLFGLTKPL